MDPQIEIGRGSIVSMAPKKLRERIPELVEAMQRIADLEALNQELETTNRTYMEMLGFVAHELKNALASAVLSLYTVKDGYLGDITPAQMRSLESVARSLEDLQEMIRNYLDLSHLEGEIQVARTYFPLNARVIQPLLEELEGQIQRRRMVVEHRIPEGKVVHADADLLKIVYRNLLTNACKYGREGGTIRLEVQEDGQTVTLSVRNDGNGIAPDQMPLLFKRFSRLYNQERPNQRGTGLGLYICRQIVEKHGGAIWADSQMGEWVNFSFTLSKAEVA
ncbi:MAG: HAMP domain-containing sensor histidine kinase [Anaerolineae bacterium]|jgi:signal transduction histidine kinase